MRKQDEQTLRDSLRNDGWSDEDIDTAIDDVNESLELMATDEQYYWEFAEEGPEDYQNA